MTLDAVQQRVLGALMEKEIATPETYPLSLNALLAAANQRSSRDPVMDVTEEQVRQALHALEDQGLTGVVRDSRVAKYEHKIRTVLSLRRDETAVVCLLLLRGAQTVGEIRGRSDRLFRFDDLEAVQSTLERLASRPEPLVVLLARQPGSREARYQHLLGRAMETPELEAGGMRAAAGYSGGDKDLDEPRAETVLVRIERLERELVMLRERFEALEERFSEGGRSGAALDSVSPAS